MLQSQSQLAAGSSQRNRIRKQSLPQRSCLDPAMSSKAVKTTATSAAPPRVNSKTQPTPSRPIIAPTAHATSTNPSPVRPAPSITNPTPATDPTPATSTGSASEGGHDVVAVHKASKPRVQAAEPRQRHPKQGMCSFCHETDSPLWRKGPEEYPHLCNRCGMRYFRYKKSDPPKDPFTQRIYDDIVSKRKVRTQPAVKATAAPSVVPSVPAPPNLQAGKRPRKAATASGSGLAQMLQDMRDQNTERSKAGQEMGMGMNQLRSPKIEDTMDASTGSENGSSDQPNPKQPRTTDSLQNLATTTHSETGKVTGSMAAPAAELAASFPAAASTPAAAAVAPCAHAQLLKFLQGPEIQAYLQRVAQTVGADSAAHQGAAHQALAAAPLLMGGLYHMNSLDSADTAQLPQL